ncbi:helix-turn-helix transcriptional regulator [Paenibacillus macquariensis]|uniref:Predicted DNA-binding transcriptional regulator YafY, contains an HTH and WYL domains n=1 Tax=Paenibacillus macquariensis TaxID=948756 RepID=A0ABY1KC42_9BACL|nr:YafY family protein [Paenibacillus macquariensis]MEC0093484.1 YafY family protein [Paenibacillus macquariensis]OAB29902.1 hypothetical protein PMSM_23465 [Paenibacillus macquariensis subsp. macquariensis]SIR57393.1 Predicted DNA-binding transcriptional regulator YafY, contains an HTH and WYL domains [Paenibacillus macquariensis]
MKFDRMLSILNILLNNEKITAKELAEKLEVSKRTIFRDIETLNMAGIPIVTYPGIGGGIGILEGYKLDKSILSTDDMQNIVMGLKVLQSFENKDIIERLITRISPNNEDIARMESNVVIDLSTWYSDGYTQTMMDDFKKAILRNNRIRIEYHSKNKYSKRTIEPYKLIFKYTDWYLYAFCTEQHDFRLFKINRISSYKYLKEIFTPMPTKDISMDFSVKENDLGETKDYPLQEIVLEYKAVHKNLLMDKIGARNFTEDGNYIIFYSSNTNWAVDLIISLQDKVKVIKPQSIVTEVTDRINKMQEQYKR